MGARKGGEQRRKDHSKYKVEEGNLELPRDTSFELEDMRYVMYALSFDFLNYTLFTKVHA